MAKKTQKSSTKPSPSGTNISPKTLSKEGSKNIFDIRRQILVELHIPLQKRIFLIATPVLFASSGYSLYQSGSINDILLFIAALIMASTWISAILIGKRVRLETSIYLFGLPVIFFETIEMTMFNGTETSCSMALMTVCIYMAIYSKRHVIVAVLLSFFSIAFSELYKYLVVSKTIQMVPVKNVLPSESLVTELVSSAVILVLFMLVIEKIRSINYQLLVNLEGNNDRQSSILEALNKIQPVIKTATNEITEISNDFAVQAAEHASSISEVTHNISKIGKSAQDSVDSANRAFTISSQVQKDAANGLSELRHVENGFMKVSDTIQNTKFKLNSLAIFAEKIEGILNYNQEIGEHIKVLAVNASIEAAKAGESGRGFSVVATEMRDLIATTDENLTSSGEILSAIRKGAAESSNEINEGSTLLVHYFDNMRKTAKLMSGIISNFSQTTMEVGKIADSAKQQGTGISQVSIVAKELNTAAGQLNQRSQDLQTCMSQINSSYQTLHDTLYSDPKQE